MIMAEWTVWEWILFGFALWIGLLLLFSIIVGIVLGIRLGSERGQIESKKHQLRINRQAERELGEELASRK